MARNTKSAERVAFAERLKKLMLDRGWNQSDVARQAGRYIDGGMGRDSVSAYVRAISLPNQTQLNGLAKAFGVEPEALVPSAGIAAREPVGMVEMKNADNGMVWLRIHQQIPFAKALQIMQILQDVGTTDNNDAPDSRAGRAAPAGVGANRAAPGEGTRARR